MNNTELLACFRENRSNNHFLMGARDRRRSHYVDWTGTTHETDYRAGWDWMRDAEPLVGITGTAPYPSSATDCRYPLLYAIVEDIAYLDNYTQEGWDVLDTLAGFLEHAPASPGPLAPALKGWSLPPRGIVCPTCAGRIMARGCRLPEGSEPLWFEPLTPCRLCLPVEVEHAAS